jgi:hypothetical protein
MIWLLATRDLGIDLVDVYATDNPPSRFGFWRGIVRYIGQLYFFQHTYSSGVCVACFEIFHPSQDASL